MHRASRANRISLSSRGPKARFERLEDRAMLAAPEIVGVSPAPNSFAPVDISPRIELDQPVTTGSAQSGVSIFGAQGIRGPKSAVIELNGSQIVIDPSEIFFAGEKVRVTATDRLKNSAGEALAAPYVWEFTAVTSPSAGKFAEISHAFPDTVYARTGDVNGDGRLDLLLVQAISPTGESNLYVLLNEGDDQFTTIQYIDWFGGRQFELGDLDGDGDLDILSAVSGSAGGSQNRVWLNNAHGVFTYLSSFGISNFYDVSLGDVDADGDLDAFTTALGFGAGTDENTLWLNNGRASFTRSNQTAIPQDFRTAAGGG